MTSAMKPKRKTLGQVALRPMDCETIADVLSLDRSYQKSGRYSMLIQHDGAVILADHVSGEPQTAAITIPRRNFHRLLEFYTGEQTVVRAHERRKGRGRK